MLMENKIYRDQYERSLENYKEVLQTDLQGIKDAFDLLHRAIESDTPEEDICQMINFITPNFELYKHNLNEYLNRRWHYKYARFN